MRKAALHGVDAHIEAVLVAGGLFLSNMSLASDQDAR